jgi:glucosylceramidase
MNVSKPVARVIIGVSRNWSRNILLWNLAADPQNGPHTNDGGCTGCVGAITIDGDNVTRQVAYYTLAHASKFVRPGSIRIGSNDLEQLPNVAFKTTTGKKVLIVSNITAAAQTFTVRDHAKAFTTSLGAGSVATYVW